MKPVLPDYIKVFPITPNAKTPAIDKWKERSCKPTELAPYFKNHNIAINAGASGLVVIDFDCSKPTFSEDAQNILDDLIRLFPTAPRVRTQSGGYHIYFRNNDPQITNRTGALPKGIDVRGNGGYVLCPPSSVEGRGYEWIVPLPDAYEDIPELPALLKNTINKTTAPESNGRSSTKCAPIDKDYRIAEAVKKIATSRNGERNNTLYTTLVSLAANGVNLEEAHTALKGAALAAGLSDSEFEATFTSASKSKMASYGAEAESVAQKMREVLDSDDVKTKTPARASLAVLMKLGVWKRVEKVIDRESVVITKGDGSVIEVPVFSHNTDFLEMLIRETKRVLEPVIEAAGFESKEERASKTSWTSLLKPLLLSPGTESKYKSIVNSIYDTLPPAKLKSRTVGFIATPSAVYDKYGNKTDDEVLSCDYKTAVDPGDEVGPLWKSFLDSFVPEDQQEALQIAVAAGALGFGPELQTAMFLRGPGGNGKTTFLQIITEVLGDYADFVPTRTFSSKSDGGYFLAQFATRRIMAMEELPRGTRLGSSFKELTTASTITVREIYKKPVVVDSQMMFFVTCNSDPQWDDTSNAIGRRMAVIDCSRVPKERNPALASMILERESEGVMRWIMDGIKKFGELWRSGQALRVFEQIQQNEINSEYKRKANVINEFLGLIAVRVSDSGSCGIPLPLLYDSFKYYFNDSFNKRITRNQFYSDLEILFPGSVKRIKSSSSLYGSCGGGSNAKKLNVEFEEAIWREKIGSKLGETDMAIHLLGKQLSEADAQASRRLRAFSDYLTSMNSRGRVEFYTTEEGGSDDDPDDETPPPTGGEPTIKPSMPAVRDTTGSTSEKGNEKMMAASPPLPAYAGESVIHYDFELESTKVDKPENLDDAEEDVIMFLDLAIGERKRRMEAGWSCPYKNWAAALLLSVAKRINGNLVYFGLSLVPQTTWNSLAGRALTDFMGHREIDRLASELEHAVAAAFMEYRLNRKVYYDGLTSEEVDAVAKFASDTINKLDDAASPALVESVIEDIVERLAAYRVRISTIAHLRTRGYAVADALKGGSMTSTDARREIAKAVGEALSNARRNDEQPGD